jgi:hypothetical protein
MNERTADGRPSQHKSATFGLARSGIFVSAWTQTLSGEAEMDCNALRRDYKKVYLLRLSSKIPTTQ